MNELKRFNYSSIVSETLTEDQRSLFDAVRSIDLGNLNEGIEQLVTLYQSSDNEEIAKQSAMLLFEQLYWNDETERIVSLKLDKEVCIDESCREVAATIQRNGGKNHNFSMSSHEAELKYSITGSPIVEVEINGERREFWLDTGAMVSVISQDVADACNVASSQDDEVSLGTATGESISSAFTLVDSVVVGNLEVERAPFIVLPTEALTISDPSLEETIKFDGIIGWDIIKYMNLKLDYANDTYTILKPVKEVNLRRNMLMDGYVVVRLKSSDDRPVYFGLDTGASATGFGEAIIDKLGIQETYNVMSRVGGITGFVDAERKVIPKLELNVNETEIALTDIKSLTHKPCNFFDLDGVIGIDMFKDGILRVDYQNGIFDIIK